MFENSDQLLEFVDKADETAFDQIFEGAISDICLYEDEYIIQALDRYVEMLESDKVDEKFEENLSNVLAPYFASTAAFYEDLIVEAPYPNQGPKPIKKPRMTMMGAKNRAKMFGAKMKRDVGRSFTKMKVGTGIKGAKVKGFLKNARVKYGPKVLAGKIKTGYQNALKWAKGTKLGQKLQGAYAAGMAKRAEGLLNKGKSAAQSAAKAAKAAQGS